MLGKVLGQQPEETNEDFLDTLWNCTLRYRLFLRILQVEQEASGKYVCSICGYVYDPAEHDGVAFEDLPDDWKCPRCKQSKEKFNKA